MPGTAYYGGWAVLAVFEKTFGGLSRQYYFRGPFAGLRVSTRAVLITSGIENLAQLRAAIAAGTVVLDDDTSGGSQQV